MTNNATIYFNNDSLSAQDCIHVYAACAALADTIITDSSFASSFPGGFIGQNVYLDGRFYVDVNSFLIQSSHVWVNTGGQIIVLNGNGLIVQNSTVEGCDEMWQGIYLENLTALAVIENSVIRDANKAIYANNKTELKLLNSSYEDNVWGLYVPYNPGLNNIAMNITGNRFGMFAPALKPGYPGQQPFGTTPYCGMELNDVVNQIGYSTADSNWFYNMNAGILGFRSRFVVENDKFQDIYPDAFYGNAWDGNAIVSVGDQSSGTAASVTIRPVDSNTFTISNSIGGVYTDYSALDIFNTDMDNLRTGIYSINCTDLLKSSVTGCYLGVTHFGINWKLNAGAAAMEARSNEIVVNGWSKGIGINMEEVSTMGTPNYTIEDNFRIDVTSGYCGIRAMNVYKPQINWNQIYQNSGISGQPPTYGIKLENDSASIISCNLVDCSDSTYTDSWGIYASMSTGTNIHCNQVTGMNTGMYFSDNCAASRLQSNTMENNFRGLELSATAVIGVQDHMGNKWINYTDTVGAVNWNNSILGLSASLFRVHTAMGTSPYYPVIPLWDNGWFFFTSGSPKICGGTCTPQLADTTEDLSLEQSIASSTFETAEFNAESQQMADQYLFDRLATDFVLMSSDPVYESFYQNHESDEIGQLNQVSSQLKLGYGYLEMDKINLQNTDSIEMAFSDSLLSSDYTLSTLAFNSLLDERQLLLDAIQVRKDSIQTIRENMRASLIMVSDSTGIINNAINTSTVIQSNEKFINEINLNLVLFGKDSLTSHLLSILGIANQCPSVGGSAVFRARMLAGLLVDSLSYEDACLGAYSNRNASLPESLTSMSVRLIPNPASDKVEVQAISKHHTIMEVELVNMLGKTVKIEVVTPENTAYTINLAGVTPGVYEVRTFLSDGLVAINKLLVVK